MNNHIIYKKCRSKETIKEYQSILAKYAISKFSEKNTPVKLHFNKEIFTLSAFNNLDYKDRTSRSVLSSSHNTVSTLLQMKALKIKSKSNKRDFKLYNAKIM